jgi:hypothetical protein
MYIEERHRHQHTGWVIGHSTAASSQEHESNVWLLMGRSGHDYPNGSALQQVMIARLAAVGKWDGHEC